MEFVLRNVNDPATILLKQQGVSTLMRARQRLDNGQIPAREMVDGIFLGVAGALLLTPGFFTDAIGFACLTPVTRTLIISFFCRHIQFQASRNAHFTMDGSKDFTENTKKGRVLEGEIDNNDKNPD